jgi:hypothetical protein
MSLARAGSSPAFGTNAICCVEIKTTVIANNFGGLRFNETLFVILTKKYDPFKLVTVTCEFKPVLNSKID